MRKGKEFFGCTKDGKTAYLYSFENKNGMRMQVTDFGAALVSVVVKGSDGKERDVVLGYDHVSGYEQGTASLGSSVGRCANRIQGACFSLNGKRYVLDQNDGNNNLHSGLNYYNKRLWDVAHVDDRSVTFTLFSPHLDQGYPGNVKIQIQYTLTDDNEIEIHYHADPDEDTIINLTNHSYFNLNGHDSGTVLAQKVLIHADAYTESDAESIPTGEIISVKGTPMDFTSFKRIGQEIDADYEALLLGKGYDHNWVLNGSGYRRAAVMMSEESGIEMEVFTDLPGLQFYTGNFLEGEKGKMGACYPRRSGACFETQYFPDAIHQEHFDSPVCKAGEVYETKTVYRFSVK